MNSTTLTPQEILDIIAWFTWRNYMLRQKSCLDVRNPTQEIAGWML